MIARSLFFAAMTAVAVLLAAQIANLWSQAQ